MTIATIPLAAMIYDMPSGVHLYGTSVEAQNDFAIADSMTMCIRNIRLLDSETIGRALNAATGLEYFESREGWDHFAHRLIILERAWNIREGLVPDRDDILPERVFTEPLTLGPKAGTLASVYDRKKFEEDKQKWYKSRGCDDHGIPTRYTLKSLDLTFVIPELEKIVTLQNE